jgi:hypothetical protein
LAEHHHAAFGAGVNIPLSIVATAFTIRFRYALKSGPVRVLSTVIVFVSRLRSIR